MGILVATLGWISSRSVFFLVGGIVAIVLLFVVWKELRGERRRLLLAPPGRGGSMSYGYLARANAAVRAMDALDEDTDPDSQRRNIIQIIANNSTDNQQTQSNIDQIIRQIASEQQQGGPLWELIMERIQGKISPQEYRQKLMEYIRNKAHENGVPLREDKLISTIPFDMRQIHLASQNIDFTDKLKFLQQQGQGIQIPQIFTSTTGNIPPVPTPTPSTTTTTTTTPPPFPPFPAFPSVTFPTLPSQTPPELAAQLQQRYQDILAQAQQRYATAQQQYTQAQQRYTTAFG